MTEYGSQRATNVEYTPYQQTQEYIDQQRLDHQKEQDKQEQELQQQQLAVQQQQQNTQQLLVIGGLSLGAALVIVVSIYLLTKAFKRKDTKSGKK